MQLIRRVRPVESSLTMISRGALVLAVAALVGGLSVPPKSFADNAESELREYIRTHSSTLRSFAESPIYPRSRLRADSSVEGNGVRKAIVLFQSQQTARSKLGSMYCHSALGQIERDIALKELDKALGGDQSLAERLASEFTPVIRFSSVEEIALKDWKQWQVFVCEARLENIRVRYPELPSQSAINQAIYDEGKSLFSKGEKNSALERFMSLKGAGLIYQNAVAFIIPIVSDSDPELGESLRRHLLNMDQVTDEDAMANYLRFLKRLGSDEELGLALETCRANEWGCGTER